MDVKDFCSAMESEMTAWKAKMYDAMRKIDKLGSADAIFQEKSGRWDVLRPIFVT